MGCTKIKVRIVNPRQPSRYREGDLLVDTGAVYTVVREPFDAEMVFAPGEPERCIT